PHRPQARLERGWMSLGIGGASRTGVALAEADTALESEPGCFEARRLRAAALLGLGRGREARDEITEASRRHAGCKAIVPSNPYEAQVLEWDEAAWGRLEEDLAKVAAGS